MDKNFSRLLFLILCMWAGSAHAGLAISPAFVDLSLDKGRPSGQFLISNVGDEEERYRINAVSYFVTADGGVREVPPDEHALSTWIRFNPKEFTLPPKSRQTVRFTIIQKGVARPGEYWAAMELESLKTTMGRGKNPQGQDMKVEVIPTILVPIFAKAGKVHYAGAVSDVKVVILQKDQRVESLVGNTGEGRITLSGTYEIVTAGGELVDQGVLGKALVLPGGERKFSARLNKKLSAGTYVVRVRYQAGELTQPLSAETTFLGGPGQTP